jgi:adenylosuccinate lyase
MIPRYRKSEIEEIFDDPNKLEEWQATELAGLKAQADLGKIPVQDYTEIWDVLKAAKITPEVIARWLALEHELNHDLNAFVHERREHLRAALRRLFHAIFTSYDTEEPAFARMLRAASLLLLHTVLPPLEEQLVRLARLYRYTPMNGRSHGQEAEMQSFGKRCLTWFVAIQLGVERLREAHDGLRFSKLSGAIGNYTEIDPEIERLALAELGLEPFYGATQIMPREVYLPMAEAVSQLVGTCEKIAHDLRLMARSGLPLVQEPFKKKQTGSSAMPHKKNTIATEKIGGMDRLAIGYGLSIRLNLHTWEERAIEQSSTERVAWPDLFHVAAHALDTLTKVLKGLNVYPDNMLREIINSRGCYASGSAKVFLAEHGQAVGIDEDAAYRIVQLAAFNAFAPSEEDLAMREQPALTLEEADDALAGMVGALEEEEELSPDSIEHVICDARLKISSQLAATPQDVGRWNGQLHLLFAGDDVLVKWREIFQPSYLLRNEPILYKKILGV